MMMFSRRDFLQMVASAAALPAASREAWAQRYPSRPVRLVVGFEPGGSADIVARLVGQWLSGRLSEPIVIENRSGASGNIGTEAVVRAPPDGYTLLLATSTNAINAALYDKLKFSFVDDIAPVAGISHNPFVMGINPSVPARSVPAFIAYAKANPGKLAMASAGIGTPHHLCGELLQMMAGITMLHVPFRGEAPGLTDLIAGRVQVMFCTTGASLEHIRSGELRALAVTTSTPQDVLPGIPALEEFVPGYEASGWFGIGAPRNTREEIVERLNTEVNAGLADPDMKGRLAALGLSVFAVSAADFGKRIAADTDKWAKVIRAVNIQPK